MQIREKGYHKWEGALKKTGWNWLPIFTTGIKSVYKKRFSKLVFAFSSAWFLLFLVAVYLSELDQIKSAGRLLGGIVKEIIGSDAALFNLFYTKGILVFTLLILALFSGAELISSDLKYKSYTLYLSRPLSILDYIKGKYTIVLFYLLLFSLVPGLLLLLAKFLFANSFTFNFYIFIALIVFPMLISLFFSSMILFFSSLTPNGRIVKVVFFSVYFFSNILGDIFYNIFRNDSFNFLSIKKNIQQFGTFVFRTKESFYGDGLISGIILFVMTLFFFLFIYRKMKKTEV